MLFLTSGRVSQIKHAYLAWFALHFLLLIAVSCHDTVWLVARGLTILPSAYRNYSQKVESVGAAIMGLDSAHSNPLGQALATYLGFAGIDAGYGYFAPNVSYGYRLVFELHYPDGHTEMQTPNAKSRAARLRLASLLDQIGHTQSEALREYVIKKVAAVTWREHPHVVTMRALFGEVMQPTSAEYERGKRETYTLLYAYDFSLAANSTPKAGQ